MYFSIYRLSGQDRLYGNMNGASDGALDNLYGGKAKDTLAGGADSTFLDLLYGL